MLYLLTVMLKIFLCISSCRFCGAFCYVLKCKVHLVNCCEVSAVCIILLFSSVNTAPLTWVSKMAPMSTGRV